MRRSSFLFFSLLVLLMLCWEHLQAQTLQVALSSDPKVNRQTSGGTATIFFDSNIEDLSIVCTEENPNEQITKSRDHQWFVNIDVNKDIEADRVCYRNFLLKSPSSGELYLRTDEIQPNQVLYYTVFLPKIAGGVPLNVDLDFDQGFDRGPYSEGVLGLLSTLTQRRLDHGSDTIKVYRNLKDNQFDQIYTITSKGMLNNVNVGDIISFIPENKSFKPLSITITDSIIKSAEIKCTLNKTRSSLHGYVIDEYTHKPVKNCMVQLYLGNYADRNCDFWGNYAPYGYYYGYKEYYESGEEFGEYLTDNNGHFGWRNCVIDYTYYITVGNPPRGYASIKFNEGINIKPQDNVNDSLIITIKPVVFKGFVTNGKNAIPNVEIECETLYGKKIVTTGLDGSFEIIGPTSEFIRFKHDDYRIMNIKIDPVIFKNHRLTIQMKKGSQKTPFMGAYHWGKINAIR